ncbi:MAG: hypothetical protein ABTQ24_09300 [Azonexus sp.]|jgi:hypothetical protein
MTTATVTKTKAASKRKAKAVAIADATLALGRAKGSASIYRQVMAQALKREREVCALEGRPFEPLPTTMQQVARLVPQVRDLRDGVEFPLDWERHLQSVLRYRCREAGVTPDPQWSRHHELLTAAQGHLLAAENLLAEILTLA